MFLAQLLLGFVRISQDHKYVLDDDREIIFHGMNKVNKEYPYISDIDGSFDIEDSMVDEDVEFFKNHSFNLIRLGVSWSGVFPQKDTVNETYLSEVDRLIQKFGEQGIYTLIDFHQDLLSKYACGNGMPLWATNYSREGILDFPRPLADPYPRLEDNTIEPEICWQFGWATYYVTAFVGDLFDCLYDPTCNHFCDVNGTNCTSKVVLQDALLDYFEVLAKHFENNEFVIGYELMNEPTPGNVFKHPLDYVNTPKFEREVLQPFYINIMKRINEFDNNHIFFFEPIVTGILQAGFDVGGPGLAIGIPSERQSFAWHLYCWTIDEHGDPVQPKVLCDSFDEFWYNQHHASAVNLQLANMCTEFGNAPDTQLSRDNLQLQVQLLSKGEHSWAYWAYKSNGMFDKNGVLVNKVRILAHPYASIIAGRSEQNFFNFDEETLTLKFVTGKQNAQTIIIIAPEWKEFGQKYTIVEGEGQVVVITKPDLITITNVHANSLVELVFY